jgi:hypothetical protein
MEIVNKVQQSGIVTINPEDFYPAGERVLFDIKEFLFHGLILKEKDFRESMKQLDWETFRGKWVAITCSTDAIVPTWAYMLIGSLLKDIAAGFIFGDLKTLNTYLVLNEIDKNLDPAEYEGKRIVIKGCGDCPIPESAYVALVDKLLPVVQTLMYGEPCSTVPIYKKKKI